MSYEPVSYKEWAAFREYIVAEGITSREFAMRIEAAVRKGWQQDRRYAPRARR